MTEATKLKHPIIANALMIFGIAFSIIAIVQALPWNLFAWIFEQILEAVEE